MNNPEFDPISVHVDEAFQSIVDADDIAACAAVTLAHVQVTDAALSVTVTDDETIQALNAQYRGVDAPTDVLSFGNEPDDDYETAFVLPDEVREEEDAYLGDILIALPYCQKQAERFGNSLQSELRLMTVHGVLHLLGYDHDTLQTESEMWEAQSTVLRELGESELAASVEKRDYGE